jgi:general secretion pathway protein A
MGLISSVTTSVSFWTFNIVYCWTLWGGSNNIPTDQLYQSHMLEETLGRLEYTAQRQMFAVLTGDCGTGKTTTIRKLKETLDTSRFMMMYLADSKLTPRHFYKGLLEQLGCEAKFYRGDAKRQLHKEIELMQGIHHLEPVVIVDEAHLLDKEMLEEVRFLLNFKMDAQSPMALILGRTKRTLGTA